jgi:hypothetical protein
MNNFIIDKEYEMKFNSKTKLWDTYRCGKLLSKSTDKLFKYFPLNLQSIDGLLRSYFYLANPGSFNDPFDCNINLLEDIEGLNTLKTVRRNNYKNIGVCSFSENIDSHLMWAHYTNNYNGFVLEFNGRNIDVKLKKNDINRHSLTRVIYPEKPVKIGKIYSFAYHYILTTKFKHWSYEKEWRIIAELNSEEREIEYYPELIKAIYIGHKIPDENISAYKMLLEIQKLIFPKAPIFVVYPHPTDLNLKFEKVLGRIS